MKKQAKNRTKFLSLLILIFILSNITVKPVYAANDLVEEYVVVLDAGHDAEHAGAQGNGKKEEELTLKITEYCKEALEQYENIKVYLTHETVECPFEGTIAKECNKMRCEYAASVDADLFISIHINSHKYRSRNGFEVIYPNANYKPEFNKAGEILSKCVVEELKKIGMNFRYIYTRESTENKKDDENFFPDGTRADYYNVIRNSKYNDILGIIIEHGYISNKSDVANYLSSEEDLKALGEADAAGIINYLKLVEGASKVLEHVVPMEQMMAKSVYLDDMDIRYFGLGYKVACIAKE